MTCFRKLPEYNELLIEYNKLIEQFKLDKKEAIEYLANKYNCRSKSVYALIRRTLRRQDMVSAYSEKDLPIEWITEFTKEWNDITKRLISGKYTIIIKKLDFKVIPASEIPKGFIY